MSINILVLLMPSVSTSPASGYIRSWSCGARYNGLRPFRPCPLHISTHVSAAHPPMTAYVQNLVETQRYAMDYAVKTVGGPFRAPGLAFRAFFVNHNNTQNLNTHYSSSSQKSHLTMIDRSTQTTLTLSMELNDRNLDVCFCFILYCGIK